MSIRIGINGFGRIGRLVFRAAMPHKRHRDRRRQRRHRRARRWPICCSYDSVHGRFPVRGQSRRHIDLRRRRDDESAVGPGPGRSSPGRTSGVDVVVESTGLFTERDKAAAHLAAGARKVIISAPGKDADATIVMGVNDNIYDPAQHHVISNASCTTNCLAPVAKVLHDTFGIKRGLMTTIHAYTNDQRILDLPHKDLRRARAAALSMIPTTTGAAKAIGLVIPELKGKLDGARHPGAGAGRIARRPDRAGGEAGHRGGGQRRREGGRRRPDAGHPRVQPGGTGVLRRHRQSALVRSSTRKLDRRHGRQPGEGLLLVRQRVGFLGPRRRAHPAHGPPL